MGFSRPWRSGLNLGPGLCQAAQTPISGLSVFRSIHDPRLSLCLWQTSKLRDPFLVLPACDSHLPNLRWLPRLTGAPAHIVGNWLYPIPQAFSCLLWKTAHLATFISLHLHVFVLFSIVKSYLPIKFHTSKASNEEMKQGFQCCRDGQCYDARLCSQHPLCSSLTPGHLYSPYSLPKEPSLATLRISPFTDSLVHLELPECLCLKAFLVRCGYFYSWLQFFHFKCFLSSYSYIFGWPFVFV